VVPLTPETEAGIQLLHPSIWMADAGRKLLAKLKLFRKDFWREFNGYFAMASGSFLPIRRQKITFSYASKYREGNVRYYKFRKNNPQIGRKTFSTEESNQN